jgi:hypothetical protein
VKGIAPVLGAGGLFTVTVLIALWAGIAAARGTGQQLWVLGGLFGGMALGGFAAVRLLLRSM